MHRSARIMNAVRPRATGGPGARTILVAEDDDELRALVCTALRDDGYAVLEARDGEDLLKQLARVIDDPSARPDVVLTDVMMPKLSGLGVLDALRRAHLRFPVILMTVLADKSVFVIARRLGALGVLIKPFDLDDLRTAIVNARAAFARMSSFPAPGRD